MGIGELPPHHTTETTHLLSVNKGQGTYHEPRLYTSRWTTLLLFSCVTMAQCCGWITYSTVADTVKTVYSAFGPIAFFPFAFHSSWAIDALGLRKTCLIAATLVAFGAICRSLAVNREYFFLAYIGQFANAAAGPIVMTYSPVLSARWFGPKERTLSTGVAATANNLGIPVAFLMGLFVNDRSSFFYMIWAEAIFCSLALILVILFYDDKPPTPPSLSNQMHEGRQRATLKQFLIDTWRVTTDPNCFNIIFTTMLSAGASSGWSSMLIIILVPLHFTQQQAQWIGFISGSLGLIGGILIGKVHDRFHGFKSTMILLYLVAALGYLYFTLAVTHPLLQYFVTPFWAIMLVIVIGSLCLNALYPLGYPVKHNSKLN